MDDRLSSDGLSRLLSAIAAAVSERDTMIVAALIAARSGPDGRDIDIARLPKNVCPDPDDPEDALSAADRAFETAFSVRLLQRGHSGRWITEGGWNAGDATDGPPKTLRLSSGLARILDEPPTLRAMSTTPPIVDPDTAIWLGGLRSAAKAGVGHHFGLRCLRNDDRELDDLAALLQNVGLQVHDAEGALGLAGELLRVERHCAAGSVVLVASDALGRDCTARTDDPDPFDSCSSGESVLATEPTDFVNEASSWLRALHTVCVWRLPTGRAVSARFDGILGGCIGPMRFDMAWSHRLLAQMDCTMSDDALRALSMRVHDPRDAGPLVKAAVDVARGNGMSMDAACVHVASSFVARPAPPPVITSDRFDPRLLVCDDEARMLLDRASAVGRNGGRVLVWGPPGGGKSTFARALGHAMSEAASPSRAIITVSPPQLLARGWGTTERLLAALWKRAGGGGGAESGSVLLIDELDALCGTREPTATSGGNAYLIRCLTDEWIRNLDAYENVPIVATVNDVLAVDPAIRRRFAFVVEVQDVLPPERERLAWQLILRSDPPPGWLPIGAAVADFAIAAARCRMLGLSDAVSLADAVARAKKARLGPALSAIPSRNGRTRVH